MKDYSNYDNESLEIVRSCLVDDISEHGNQLKWAKDDLAIFDKKYGSRLGIKEKDNE